MSAHLDYAARHTARGAKAAAHRERAQHRKWLSKALHQRAAPGRLDASHLRLILEACDESGNVAAGDKGVVCGGYLSLEPLGGGHQLVGGGGAVCWRAARLA